MTLRAKALPQPQEALPERQSAPGASTRIGRIISVSGSQAIAVQERSDKGAECHNGSRIEIGSLVKILTPETIIVGMVSAVTSPMADEDTDQSGMRLIELNLAGEIVAGEAGGKPYFRRGVANFRGSGISS
jgi:hypothetical protein